MLSGNEGAGSVSADTTPGRCFRISPLAPISPWMSNYDLLAPTVHRLMSVVTGGDWHLDEVAEIVSFDPVMTAKLLCRVNSAARASRVEIVDVKHAVSHIGISLLTSLVTRRVCRGGRTARSRSVASRRASSGSTWSHRRSRPRSYSGARLGRSL